MMKNTHFSYGNELYTLNMLSKDVKQKKKDVKQNKVCSMTSHLLVQIYSHKINTCSLGMLKHINRLPWWLRG